MCFIVKPVLYRIVPTTMELMPIGSYILGANLILTPFSSPFLAISLFLKHTVWCKVLHWKFYPIRFWLLLFLLCCVVHRLAFLEGGIPAELYICQSGIVDLYVFLSICYLYFCITCICPNYEMYLFELYNVFVQIGGGIPYLPEWHREPPLWSTRR